MTDEELRCWLDYATPNAYSVLYEHAAYLQVLKFGRIVAASEREACAKMVDHIRYEGGGTYGDAIRGRVK